MKTSTDSPESQLQQRGKMAPVKREIVDESAHYDQQHVSPNERTKYQEYGIGSSPVSPAQINPQVGSGPLGLRPRMSDSLLDLIRTRFSERKEGTATSAATKLMASAFPGSHLEIGTWEYKPTREGDLVARCYYGRRKLIWEVFYGHSKNRIEIRWSDIMALKATCPNGGPGSLYLVLNKPPLFFREKTTQPRTSRAWEATKDFTGGQASLHRCHFLQCPQGSFNKHFRRLIQSDLRDKLLGEQSQVALESPYFESVQSLKSGLYEPNERNKYDLSGERHIFDLHTTASTTVSQSGGQSSTSRSQQHDPSGRHGEFSSESPSVMDKPLIEVFNQAGAEGVTDFSHWDRIIVPGINPSMSLTDLINYVDNRITEQRTSCNHHPSREEKETLVTLEDISRCLFDESQHESTLFDQKSVIEKANSLCSLLHKAPTNFQDLEPRTDRNEPRPVSGLVCDGGPVPEGTGMSRKASVGDLRSQFFYNFQEE